MSGSGMSANGDDANSSAAADDVEAIRCKEDAAAAVEIEAPAPMDVICGRGKNIAHPGNRRFHMLVLSRKEAYQKAKRRDEKTSITDQIVHELRRGSIPCRFLLKDPKTKKWFEVGDDYAHEKVSHALRSIPKEERRKRDKLNKKATRKPDLAPEVEETVQTLINDQQELLRSYMAKAAAPSGARRAQSN